MTRHVFQACTEHEDLIQTSIIRPGPILLGNRASVAGLLGRQEALGVFLVELLC